MCKFVSESTTLRFKASKKIEVNKKAGYISTRITQLKASIRVGCKINVERYCRHMVVIRHEKMKMQHTEIIGAISPHHINPARELQDPQFSYSKIFQG